MTKEIKIKINSKSYLGEIDETIFEIAEKNKLFIPTLCHHPDLKSNESCRICLVEIIRNGKKEVVASCSTKIFEGMEIFLDTAKVKKSRKLNLELLFSDHYEKCPECNWVDHCQLKKLSAEFGIKENRFSKRRREAKIDKKTSSMFWDSSKCIECGNCLSTCDQIVGLKIIKSKYTGSAIIFGPDGGQSFSETNCVYCGQCILRCPSGSLQEKYDIENVEHLIKKKGRNVLIAQFAPSARYSIAELFGESADKNYEKKLISALKKIGFDYVFDVNFGADITTVEEAEELEDRLESKGALPMFTSCCPAWVRYLEIFHHELLPNLTTTKSPNQCLSVAIKTHFSKVVKISARRIKIVSIMPCIAKKYESQLPELRLGHRPACDYVLTVREAGRLLKKNNIDLSKIEDSEFDSLLSEATGAGYIYGASGGVMESALRTLAAKNCQNDCQLEFSAVRGLKGVKEASVEVAGKKLEVAVVSGLKNAIKLLKDIKSGVKHYHYIEVMACPGGCLGGGGQPIPTTPEIREQRKNAFYTDDSSKKVRRAHENKDLIKMYEGLNAKPLSEKAEKLFHRKFIRRQKK